MILWIAQMEWSWNCGDTCVHIFPIGMVGIRCPYSGVDHLGFKWHWWLSQVFWMLFQNGKCMSSPVLNYTRSWEAPTWEMSILRMHLDDFLYHCGCPAGILFHPGSGIWRATPFKGLAGASGSLIQWMLSRNLIIRKGRVTQTPQCKWWKQDWNVP
jgi:hypothetical protein